MDNFISKIKNIVEATETYLSSQTGTVKMDVLVAEVMNNLSLEDSEVSNVVNTIRYYIKTDSEYEIARGVGGGIKKKNQKTTNTKKSKVKEEVKANVQAKIASMTANQKPIEIKSEPEVSDADDSGLESVEMSDIFEEMEI